MDIRLENVIESRATESINYIGQLIGYKRVAVHRKCGHPKHQQPIGQPRLPVNVSADKVHLILAAIIDAVRGRRDWRDG